MSCNCTPPERTSLWTPIPELRQPTDILPGENIDCYARRTGDQTGEQDDARLDLENRIQNTSVKVTKVGDTYQVNELMTVSQGPRTAKTWSVNPTAGTITISNDGKLVGEIPEGVHKITVNAADERGNIDSREFTLVAAEAQKGESISLIIPYRSTNGQTPRCNSGFGPRMHPIKRVMKLHKGQDWVGGRRGEILSAADGEVVFCGSAGGYGMQVRVNHLAANGAIIAQTTYSHLSQILVQRGQKVGQGQVIAKEGSTGASTGPHLHFELLLGGKQHVDPMPYINGKFEIQPPTQSDGSQPPLKSVDNSNPTAITLSETNARTASDCPQIIDSGAPPFNSSSQYGEPSEGFDNQSPTTSECKPAVRPTYEEVVAQIDEALNEEVPALDEEDKNLIKFIARIESRFDPYAKNPTSSAMGLYQMLDKIAVKYYGEIKIDDVKGIPPSCVNRCNPYFATKAMILFYKKELVSYYDKYIASARLERWQDRTLAGKTIKWTPHSNRYHTLSKAEFCYGLIHHDGVGNAVAGKDLQGVDYFRRKARELSYS